MRARTRTARRSSTRPRRTAATATASPGPNLGAQAGVRALVRVRHGAELPQQPARPRRDDWYRKQTKDQIVNDIRGSYATGFILFNLNGAVTRNKGVEAHAARHAGR